MIIGMWREWRERRRAQAKAEARFLAAALATTPHAAAHLGMGRVRRIARKHAKDIVRRGYR
jgi:hypothetical protein